MKARATANIQDILVLDKSPDPSRPLQITEVDRSPNQFGVQLSLGARVFSIENAIGM
jgi:hypothetical protein